MKKKRLLETLLISIVGAIMILPEFFFWEVVGHELYHTYKHTAYAEKMCIDYNYPYTSHVLVDFPDDETRENYNIELENIEEAKANKIGRIASVLYTVFIMLTLIWIISFVKRIDQEK